MWRILFHKMQTSTKKRILPPTLAVPKSESIARNRTRLKRRLCQTYYDVVVNTLLMRNKFQNDPRTSFEACWRKVCHRKYTEMCTPGELEVKISRAVYEWATHQYAKIFACTDIQHLHIKHVTGQIPCDDETQIAAIEMIKHYITFMDECAINKTIKGLTDIETEVLFFLIHGQESGNICPICMDSKWHMSSMTRNCDHRICTDCARNWAQNNTVLQGVGCMWCTQEGKSAEKCIADPWRILSNTINKFEIPAGLGVFVAYQNAALQRYYNVKYEPCCDMLGKCPKCNTVSMAGSKTIRRCMNPKCSVDFCMTCLCIIDFDSSLETHHNKECLMHAAERKQILDQKGFSQCPTCDTHVWHARGHGCHGVSCPMCRTLFCHACRVTYRSRNPEIPACSCPIFCNDKFRCSCANTCPECVHSSCIHCRGVCDTCRQRQSNL